MYDDIFTRPFRALNPVSLAPTWRRVTQLSKDVVYHQGNMQEFIKMTGWSGDRVLYFGDHVYSDLAVCDLQELPLLPSPASYLFPPFIHPLSSPFHPLPPSILPSFHPLPLLPSLLSSAPSPPLPSYPCRNPSYTMAGKLQPSFLNWR